MVVVPSVAGRIFPAHGLFPDVHSIYLVVHGVTKGQFNSWLMPNSPFLNRHYKKDFLGQLLLGNSCLLYPS
jgi:hypothetical protein